MDKLRWILRFIKNNYLFAFSFIALINGVEIIGRYPYGYKATDAEIIGQSIYAGLLNIAGAILIGLSILCLILNSRKKD